MNSQVGPFRMQDRPWHLVPALVAYVFGSSVLGLAAAMATAGPRIFAIVWGASLLGDVLFAGGMAGVGIGAYHLVRRSKVASLALGFIGAWLVYTLAWSVTAPAISPENNQGFASAGPEVWGFTLQWGWPGILFSGAVPLVFALVMKRTVPARAGEAVAPERPTP